MCLHRRAGMQKSYLCTLLKEGKIIVSWFLTLFRAILQVSELSLNLVRTVVFAVTIPSDFLAIALVSGVALFCTTFERSAWVGWVGWSTIFALWWFGSFKQLAMLLTIAVTLVAIVTIRTIVKSAIRDMLRWRRVFEVGFRFPFCLMIIFPPFFFF